MLLFAYLIHMKRANNIYLLKVGIIEKFGMRSPQVMSANRWEKPRIQTEANQQEHYAAAMYKHPSHKNTVHPNKPVWATLSYINNASFFYSRWKYNGPIEHPCAHDVIRNSGIKVYFRLTKVWRAKISV
ncbi:MAG: hypothetical protein COB99_01340, partial [Sulfurimonas sp.]